MKTTRILSYIIALCVIIPLALISVKGAAYEITENSIMLDFSAFSIGSMDKRDNAITTRNVTFDGKNCMRIIPNPESTVTGRIVLDAYSLGQYASQGMMIKPEEYKYVSVEYYYDAGENPSYSGQMSITLLPGSSAVITESAATTSSNNMVSGKWDVLYFDFTDKIVINPDKKKDYLTQIHVNPFDLAAPSTLTADDVLYISTVTFHKDNPDANATVDFTFIKNNPDVVGENFTLTPKYNSDFALPECPFQLKNAAFVGWKNSWDDVVYKAGETVRAVINTTYTSVWEVVPEVKDFISLDFAEYTNGIVNGRDTAILGKTEKDGRTAVKVIPNPESKQGTTINVDGYKYRGTQINLEAYQWFAVEYYYESPKPIEGMKMRIGILNTGSPPPLLSGKSHHKDSLDTIKANEWSIAVFDMSGVQSVINPDSTNKTLSQTHTYPFGTTKVANLTTDDVMYISRIMFFSEKPAISSCHAYIKGYGDGTFRPGNFLTRAEACALVARVCEDEEGIVGKSPYGDVDSDAWYSDYIGYCYENGFLDFHEESNFHPDKAITKSELSALALNASLCAKGHGRLPDTAMGYDSVEGITGFLGDTDKAVTRAEAVKAINLMFGISKTTDKLSLGYPLLFLDVDFNHWAFADIAEAAIPHVEAKGKWLYPTSDPIKQIEKIVGEDKLYKKADGYKKIEELDELEARRISEIKSTPNMDLSNISGKRIYVSMSGDDTNDGLSEETAVRTLTFANSLAASGDAVLLERGGLWREQITGKKGVTYTAYGTGEKPIIYGSPEDGADPDKWTLVYENEETGALIWKYHKEDWLDVGGLVFDGGVGIALKDLPDNIGSEYLVYGNREEKYDYTVGLDRNFEFFHDASSVVGSTYIDCNNAKGALYFRCDNGNPGKVFDSIEFIARGASIRCGGNSDVTVDNICFKYVNFGVSTGTTKNITVTNCEFYWIGGCIQTYSMRDGVATRYGNAIEVYGGIDGYLVDNCYFYEVYDAAVTHQVSNDDTNLKMDNIVYSNNVMDKCQYSIEYFFGGPTVSGIVRNGRNVLFTGNLCRRAGYGFGSTRRDIYSQRHIRSGGSRNEFYDFRIENNIFDRSVYELVQTTCSYEANKPSYNGNTYIQGIGNRLFSHSVAKYAYNDFTAATAIRDILGDGNARHYYVDYIPLYSYDFNYEKTVPVTDEERAGLAK
ncbi:MAG: S-layer homology domain-containing protein [Clostridia bacterium]|nr:S-layer homology domain-containing protein [Clostridia bacterium]